VTSDSKFVGRLMMAIASNGHLELTHNSELYYITSLDSLLDADTAADAQKLGDERNLVRRFHFDT